VAVELAIYPRVGFESLICAYTDDNVVCLTAGESPLLV